MKGRNGEAADFKEPASSKRDDAAGHHQDDVGLCGTCLHARGIGNARGSRFYLCTRSKTDARYPRYPRLPMLDCSGWEHR